MGQVVYFTIYKTSQFSDKNHMDYTTTLPYSQAFLLILSLGTRLILHCTPIGKLFERKEWVWPEVAAKCFDSMHMYTAGLYSTH